eukprot:scaffold53005_cov45-Phaeocystis_antarctica.AAC.1
MTALRAPPAARAPRRGSSPAGCTSGLAMALRLNRCQTPELQLQRHVCIRLPSGTPSASLPHRLVPRGPSALEE